MGYLSWLNSYKTVNDLSIQLQNQISSRIYLQLNNYLQNSHKLNQIHANAIEQGLLKTSDLRGMEKFFFEQMQTFETVPYTAWGSQTGGYVGIDRLRDGRLNIEAVELTTKPKYYTYAANNQGQRGKLLQITPFYDPRKRPWYQEAVQKGRATWSSIYVWFNQAEIAIDATLPVYDQKGTLLGVLDTPFKLSRIGDYLQQLKISKTGQSFIIERSGLLVASSSNNKPFILNKDKKPQRIKASDSDNKLIKQSAEYLQQRFTDLSAIKQTMKLKFSQNHQRIFLQVLPFQDNHGIDWLIIVAVPESDFMERIYDSTRMTIILCIAASLIAIAVGILTARWVTKPILYLNNSAKSIAKGEWDKTLQIERSDELGELAHSFNSMATQLQKSFSQMQELNVELTELNQTLEDRVSKRTAELKTANEELEAFSYSVSHDLQAPLRKIDSFSQIILERYGEKLDDSGKNYIVRMRANTQRMQEIIRDLLTLSRVNRAQMQRSPVNLSAIAKQISENLQEMQPERQVEWVIAPELVVNADASLIKIVLENLFNNAWKFTSNQISPRIEFNTINQEDGKLAYFVRDNGAGFDITYVNQLFKAFQRLHSASEYPGTGIGLAIVQRIIQRHGGQVWAEGLVGTGATFYFTFTES